MYGRPGDTFAGHFFFSFLQDGEGKFISGHYDVLVPDPKGRMKLPAKVPAYCKEEPPQEEEAHPQPEAEQPQTQATAQQPPQQHEEADEQPTEAIKQEQPQQHDQADEQPTQATTQEPPQEHQEADKQPTQATTQEPPQEHEEADKQPAQATTQEPPQEEQDGGPQPTTHDKQTVPRDDSEPLPHTMPLPVQPEIGILRPIEKVLCIGEAYHKQIFKGKKSWELRGRPWKFRGDIGVRSNSMVHGIVRLTGCKLVAVKNEDSSWEPYDDSETAQALFPMADANLDKHQAGVSG